MNFILKFGMDNECFCCKDAARDHESNASPKEDKMKILSKFCLTIFWVVVYTSLTASFSFSQTEGNYVLTIKDHQFFPRELVIPAHKKVKIILDNQDSTPEEFESHDLNREKLVTGNGKTVLFIGPLKPGTYKYSGEFHEKTAQGVIRVE